MSRTGRHPHGPHPWLRLVAPALAVIIGLVALRLLMPRLLSQQQLSGWLARLGHLGPLVFVLILAARPLTLLPGQMLAAVGGMLFGALWGGVYSLIGSFLSNLLVFFLSRRLGGGRLVKRLAGSSYPGLVRAAKKHDFQLAVIVTFVPLFPTDVFVAAAAASRARLWPTTLGVVLGSVPGTFLTAQFGSALGQGKPLMTVLMGAGVMVSVVLGALVGRSMLQEIAAASPEGQPCGEPEEAARRPLAASRRVEVPPGPG